MYKVILNLTGLLFFTPALSLAAPVPMAPVTSATYELKVEFAIDGKVVSSPRMIVLADKKEMISEREPNSKNGTFIEVVTRDESTQDGDAILMHFVVGTIDRDGNRIVLAEPKILTLENSKAMVETSGHGRKSL